MSSHRSDAQRRLIERMRARHRALGHGVELSPEGRKALIALVADVIADDLPNDAA